MTISLVIVMGMLSLYKFSIGNIYGNSSSRGMVAAATQDGQLATGLLVAQQNYRQQALA